MQHAQRAMLLRPDPRHPALIRRCAPTSPARSIVSFAIAPQQFLEVGNAPPAWLSDNLTLFATGARALIVLFAAAVLAVIVALFRYAAPRSSHVADRARSVVGCSRAKQSARRAAVVLLAVAPQQPAPLPPPYRA